MKQAANPLTERPREGETPLEFAKRIGNKGLQMYLEAEEETERIHLEQCRKDGEERRANIALLGLTPEQAKQYSFYQLREMAAKKRSGSPDSTDTTTT